MVRKAFLILFILSFTYGYLLAQPNPGGEPNPVPIDGGLIYLILGGLAIGIKKIMDHRKKS